MQMNNSDAQRSHYTPFSTEPCDQTSEYIWPQVLAILAGLPARSSILDAGCGNGRFSRALCDRGFRVHGIDGEPSGPSASAINAPSATFSVGSVDDDLRQLPGAPFDAVVSLEVIEHLYRPKLFIERARECLRPDGLLVVSTPYHGYLKNLILAASGKMDAHFTARWEGGHIKFWSKRTLAELCESEGLLFTSFAGVGRLPYLWKSMVLAFRKPAGP
jgi:2-polyprenyl-3-methyl-5-hydroxy-6-metoxy-1,4-benzoquinol methylase